MKVFGGETGFTAALMSNVWLDEYLLSRWWVLSPGFSDRKTKGKGDAMAVLLVMIMFVGIVVGSYLLNGWVLFKLWGWFMVPFGLPPLSIPWAIGVAIVVGFLTFHHTLEKMDEDEAVKYWVMIIVRPLMALFVGWIVHSFMG